MTSIQILGSQLPKKWMCPFLKGYFTQSLGYLIFLWIDQRNLTQTGNILCTQDFCLDSWEELFPGELSVFLDRLCFADIIHWTADLKALNAQKSLALFCWMCVYFIPDLSITKAAIFTLEQVSHQYSHSPFTCSPWHCAAGQNCPCVLPALDVRVLGELQRLKRGIWGPRALLGGAQLFSGAARFLGPKSWLVLLSRETCWIKISWIILYL